MLELTRAPEILKSNGEGQEKPSQNALVREAELIWSGVSSTPHYLQEAFNSEQRLSTTQSMLFSAGITAALACIKRSPSLAWTAGKVLAPALTVSFVKDIATNAQSLAGAMSDNWQSDANWNKNVSVARESIGRFSADFILAAAASGLTERAARSYFELKSPGVSKLPELNRANILANWQKHMDGEILPYRFYTEKGGGARQVDLFLPPEFKMPADGTQLKSAQSLLIAQDGLKLDFGVLRNLRPPDHGLVRLKSEPGLDFVAAYTHPMKFRVLPGVNISAWHHQSGLIKEGGLFAPRTKFSDLHFLSDLEKSLSGMLSTRGTTLAGFSSGAMLANEAAAYMGPSRVQSVISVSSTVTGKEPPARAGQFRLIVRDTGDPTLPQNGGAGLRAGLLPTLGHKAILSSRPSNQAAYGLAPYAESHILSAGREKIGYSWHNYALKDGTPVLTEIRTNTGSHGWNSRHVFGQGEPHNVEAAVMKTIYPNINQLVKEVVNGNLQRFRVSSQG